MAGRQYYIHAYKIGTAETVTGLSRTVTGPTSDVALDLAETLSEQHDFVRFVVSNDRGRTLAAFEQGDFEYLGY